MAKSLTDSQRRRWSGHVACLGVVWGLAVVVTGTTSTSRADEPTPDRDRPNRNTTAAAAERPRPQREALEIIQVLRPADLDARLVRALAASNVAPAPRAGDAEFVRRVYLDVVGTPPTSEQVRAFVEDRSEDKRARLIDALLERPEFARNWARYWRDVIRFNATTTNLNQVRYDALEDWLAEQLEADDATWDTIAIGLITASGRNDQNGATNLVTAHMARPAELAGEVSRLFLGMQIQCAECHDHPYDSWTREQFHEFAAFLAGLRTRRATPPGQGRLAFEVVPRDRLRYTMPDLENPRRGIPVAPKFFLDPSDEPLPANLSSDERRARLASYITAQDNPWFARAFVNRVWYELMGEAFYTPVDDLGPERATNAPEVLDALASAWQQGGYDIRWLFRTILNTEAYQREAHATDTPEGRTSFASNCPSRLRADQIFDRLGQALGLPTEAARNGRRGGNPRGPLRDPRFSFNRLFGVDPSLANDEVLGTIPQALFLMNSPQVNRAIRAGRGTMLSEVLATHPDNREALEQLYLRVLARAPNADEVATCLAYLREVGNRREAFEDILWSLINSAEFVSRY